MHLIENVLEQKLLLDLPPHARDIAMEYISTKSLGELLDLWQETKPDLSQLSAKNIPHSMWKPLINAALLAKVTYFLPNPDLTQEEMLFLIKIACMSAGYPLNTYSLADVMVMTKEDMPVLHNWLQQFADFLLEQSE